MNQRVTKQEFVASACLGVLVGSDTVPAGGSRGHKLGPSAAFLPGLLLSA